MRLALFALLAPLALPACAPYGYGYADTYSGAVYGAPAYDSPVYGAPGYGASGYGAPVYGAPVYGAPGPYYAPPAYIAPAAPNVLLFGGGGRDRDNRWRGDRGDYRRRYEGRRNDQVIRQRPQGDVIRSGRERAAQPGPVFRPTAPPPASRPPHFNPANPTAQGGPDR